MELALSSFSHELKTSAARFGNVAFSDGSLLYSALNRLKNNQPLVAPIDIKRYFITHEEAAKLSLIAAFCSKTSEIYVPKIKKLEAQKDFPTIINNLLNHNGFKMYITKTEDEARLMAKNNKSVNWPCYLFKTDTTGEKKEEEFLSSKDLLIHNEYKEIEVVNTRGIIEKTKVILLLKQLKELSSNNWDIVEIKKLVKENNDKFNHDNKDKSLEEKM